MEHPAASFYRLQMGTTLCWWLLVRKSTGRTVEEVARSEVITRPAWLPVRLLRVLHAPRVRKGIFLLPLAGLGAGVLSSIGGSAPPLLLRAELASGTTVLATGLNVVQRIPAPAGQVVDPQSAWLLRRILAHAATLAVNEGESESTRSVTL